MCFTHGYIYIIYVISSTNLLLGSIQGDTNIGLKKTFIAISGSIPPIVYGIMSFSGICVIKASNIHRLKDLGVQIMKWYVANISHLVMTLNGNIKGQISLIVKYLLKY